MITRREFTLLAATALAVPVALLEACKGTSAPAITPAPKSTAAADMQMTWWGNADRARRTNQVISLFQQKNPQYKISSTWGPFSSYFDKLNTQVAGGSPPDILQMDMRSLLTYTNRGVLLELGQYAPGTLDLGDFDKALLKPVQTKKGLFGLPAAANMYALLYNETLLGKAGTAPPKPGLTWEQFADYCLALARALSRSAWPVDDHSGTIAPFEGWIHSRGKDFYTSDGKLGFSRQDALDWFSYWGELRKAGATVPADISAAASNASSQSQSVLATGKAVMFLTHSNFLEQYQPLIRDKLGIGPYPVGSRPAVFSKVSQLICVAAKTKSPSQAVQFLNFWINDPQANKALSVERGAPPTVKMRDLIKGLLTAEQKAELDYLEQNVKGTTPPTNLAPPGAGEVEQALSRAGQSIGLGGASVRAATDKFRQEADQALR